MSQLIPDSAAVPSPKAAHRVLIVEDEEVIRRFVSVVLKAAGYEVLTAANGDEALATSASGAPIDLLVTDMLMPRMTGKQLVEKMRERQQGLKALFVSGYGPDDSVNGEVIGGGAAFLQKPFTRDTLISKVKEVLGT